MGQISCQIVMASLQKVWLLYELYLCLVSDSTAQYIHGYESVQADNGVYTEGLQCVVVLIGAYHIPTGLPIIGAMNQPFAEKNTQSGR